MSEARGEAVETYDAGRGDDDQESHPTSNSVDGGPIFSMYLKRAEEEDKRTAEGWKEEAEKVFLFTGLFSAVVASFISLSIQDIQANPQDTSNFYLASIHQALTNPNTTSNISLPSSPPPFSPPTYGIWVNSLWFLSLVMSMTCAVLANLLQQWARKYLKVTRPRPTASEPMQVRYHAFYADGVENFLLPWVVEVLPAMLHLSVFLFFAGLVVFLWNFDPTISKLMLSWVTGCVILYGYITFIPTFRHDSPYHTPFSPLVWSIVTGIPFLLFRNMEKVTYDLIYALRSIPSGIRSCIQRIRSSSTFCSYLLSRLDAPNQFIRLIFKQDVSHWAEAADRHRKKFVQGLQKTAEKAALDLQLGLSGRAFMWTFDSLHEDNELECFFSSLPSFRGSNDDEDILSRLTEDQKENLWTGLIGFLDRTLSSDSLHETVKNRRAEVCTNALNPAALPYILDGVVSENQYGPVLSAKIANFFRRWDDGTNEATSMLVQAIVSGVITTVRLRNDYWYTIVSNELGVGENVLRNYATPDLSFAILIHVTCQQYNHLKQSSWPSDKFAKVLRAASKFEVRLSSPELQRGFCALWNHIFRQVLADDVHSLKIARFILRPIHKVYIGMHKRTFAASRTRPFAPAGNFADIRINTHNDDDITFARIAALVRSTPETSSSRVVTTAPGTSPVMSAAAEDDANRAIIANTLDPYSSSLPSVADPNVSIADRSQETNAGCVGDRPPHISHFPYNIV